MIDPGILIFVLLLVALVSLLYKKQKDERD